MSPSHARVTHTHTYTHTHTHTHTHTRTITGSAVIAGAIAGIVGGAAVVIVVVLLVLRKRRAAVPYLPVQTFAQGDDGDDKMVSL